METPELIKMIALIVGLLGCYITGYMHGHEMGSNGINTNDR